ncbi:MAG: YgiQ family radical SAM protein [Candidatus Omnitrophica bacterium]|nr:YgiQ family radical SAM protein [Candidatus Omnitrophota bacterium]
MDIILITGDAYVDHPSYGAAVIRRVLEAEGFSVGIIAQPDWRSPDDFLKLGRPRLFFGITAGNLDSMVANYTANKRPRRTDDYSPGGKAGLRPDRAVIVYTNRIRQAFPGAPVVIGGIEASLRRLAHYDYWDNDIRRSVLLDSKADILVYGMAEAQVREIAKRLKAGADIKTLNGIRGTVVVRNSTEGLGDFITVPSFEEVKKDKEKFNRAFRDFYLEFDPVRGRTVVQPHAERFVIQYPPAPPLGAEDLDKIALLNYNRKWLPAYDKQGGVPGFETVKFSIIAHRGCCGECGFCSLYFHQGRIVQSRSPGSILEEIKILAGRQDFKGTITDIGGPTANMYQAQCQGWKKQGACRDRNCLMPSKCGNLKMGYKTAIDLLKDAVKIPKVRHVFIGSGLRYDLLNDKESEGYLSALCAGHISGQLKAAPEHTEDTVLGLMNKPAFEKYKEFEKKYTAINRKLGKEQYIVNYFISSHPGAGLREAFKMAVYLLKQRIHPEQIQDFLPLPMTASACMYYTEKNPFTGRPVYVAKTFKERKMQRALMQCTNPNNRKLVLEALNILGENEKRSLFFGNKKIRSGKPPIGVKKAH